MWFLFQSSILAFAAAWLHDETSNRRWLFHVAVVWWLLAA
jgi:hypothetical protein